MVAIRTASRTAIRGVVAALTLSTVGTVAAAQDGSLEGIGHDLGNPEAPVLVIEYGDFACSACAQFARDTWPVVRSDFIETGLVRWKMVPFDLGFRNSEESARAGECAAADGRFWEMHDALFERRTDWVDERNPKDEIVALAVGVGLSAERFLECYEDKTFEGRTEAANRAAKEAGVRGTPTFVVNGLQVQGALPLEAFRSVLIEAARGR